MQDFRFYGKDTIQLTTEIVIYQELIMEAKAVKNPPFFSGPLKLLSTKLQLFTFADVVRIRNRYVLTLQSLKFRPSETELVPCETERFQFKPRFERPAERRYVSLGFNGISQIYIFNFYHRSCSRPACMYSLNMVFT